MTKELKTLWDSLSGLSKPSKMPCHGYSISALACKMGGYLRSLPNSVCSKCYAVRGNYRFPTIQSCLNRRMEAFNLPNFVPNMITLITEVEKSGFFRWFDSGDVQNLEMLEKIVAVAKGTPHIQHWLPTKEYFLVWNYLKSGKTFPSNLNVRLSAFLVNHAGPIALAKKLDLTVSEVRTTGFSCPAPNQGNKCLSCRACWDKSTLIVSYKKH